MKHLLTFILLIAFTSAIYMRQHNVKQIPIALPRAVSGKEVKTDENIRYYGDTLYQYDGKVIVGQFEFDWEEPSSDYPQRGLITFRDTIPIDTTRVIGYGNWTVKNDTIVFAVGVDTISYPLRNLPDVIDLDRDFTESKFITIKHCYHHSFELSDISDECGMSFTAYLPPNHPEWVNQFISTLVRNDIQAIFLHNKGSERIFNEYFGIIKEPIKIIGLDTYGMSPEEIARYYSVEFESQYRKEFNTFENLAFTPRYVYSFSMAPAWISPDGKLITYRFFNYCHTSGIHGYMEEYYLTFDNETGRLFGRKDFFNDAGFNLAINLLEKEISFRSSDYPGLDAPYPSQLEKSELSANASEIIKEIKDGEYYPRPALTDKGMVFSYQPYEKAAFCDGIRHYTIPYKNLMMKISRQ